MRKSPVNSSPGVTERQSKALINLLADEDPWVYDEVRKKLVALGDGIVTWLKPHLLSNDPVLRRHSREIVSYFGRQEKDNAFLTFCLTQGEEFDLEQALLMLAATRYDEINLGGYHALLDCYAASLRELVDPGAPPAQILAACNYFLFEELGFHGNEQHQSDPESGYLSRVIDRRTGSPLSLCALYLVVARRLRLPVTGIALPGHFVLRYQSAREEIYVDAFNKGKLLTKIDCVKYVAQTQRPPHENHLAPVSSRRILLRICAGLHQVYSQNKDRVEEPRVQRYLIALAK